MPAKKLKAHVGLLEKTLARVREEIEISGFDDEDEVTINEWAEKTTRGALLSISSHSFMVASSLLYPHAWAKKTFILMSRQKPLSDHGSLVNAMRDTRIHIIIELQLKGRGCARVCPYVCQYVCSWVRACLSVCLCLFLCLCLSLCLCLCVHVCVSVSLCACVCACVCVCVRACTVDKAGKTLIEGAQKVQHTAKDINFRKMIGVKVLQILEVKSIEL